MLQKAGPKPLIDHATLRTKSDWVAAGREVFEQLDHFTLRTYDPKVIAAIRAPELSAKLPLRISRRNAATASLGAHRTRRRHLTDQLRELSHSRGERWHARERRAGTGRGVRSDPRARARWIYAFRPIAARYRRPRVRPQTSRRGASATHRILENSLNPNS